MAALMSALPRNRAMVQSGSSMPGGSHPALSAGLVICPNVLVIGVLYAPKAFPRERRSEMMGRALHKACRLEGSERLCGSSVGPKPPLALRQRGVQGVLPGATLTSQGCGRRTAAST